MTLIAHAIVAAPSAAVSEGGLRGRRLICVEADDLGIWCTEWESGLELGRADALEHHQVVERICAAEACLPVRFGTVFAEDDAARASLRGKAETLRAALERVAGKVELALTLLWRTPSATEHAAPVESGPGRRYLEVRREHHAVADARRARADAMVAQILDDLAIDRSLVWHETCTSDGVAVSLAVLLPSDGAGERKAALERIGRRFPDALAVVNGPWPPYTFARIE